MYTRNRGGILWRGLIIALLSSLMTGVLLMMFIPAYIDRSYRQMQNMNSSNNADKVPGGQNLAYTEAVRKEQSDEKADILDVTGIAKKVMPAVVGISTSTIDGDDLFRSDMEEIWSVGSGVIVSENGYILTNHHVIGNNPNQIVVTLSNGKTVNAKSEWSDSTLDLAVIKVDFTGLPVAQLGDSDEIRVGETAVAIGNPLGLQFQRTVTAGIISAINRTIQVTTDGRRNYMEGLIQTDASINPGNSGGPLINSKGEVIGINTIKVVSAEGMGFAIPINIAKPVIESFLDKGEYVTPYMGLFAYDHVVAEYVNQGMDIQKGVYVTEVDKNGPVYKAGIRAGDIITHMDDEEVNTMLELRQKMFKCGHEKSCKIRFIRHGKVMEAQVKLSSRTNDGLITR
ncbi:MAG: trypsin-like serine protease [Clostridiaceae bacterium]|nr:trypsin-like serine protease [Clostridiaceae bacterium]